jgi:hypothetical protein
MPPVPTTIPYAAHFVAPPGVAYVATAVHEPSGRYLLPSGLLADAPSMAVLLPVRAAAPPRENLRVVLIDVAPTLPAGEITVCLHVAGLDVNAAGLPREFALGPYAIWHDPTPTTPPPVRWVPMVEVPGNHADG